MAGEPSLRRQVLATLLASIAAVMLVALVLSALLLRYALARDFETRLRTLAQDFQTSITLRDGDAIDLSGAAPDGPFDQRFSGWYWMVSDGQSIIARSRSLVAESIALGELSTVRQIEGPQGVPLLAISLPVRSGRGLVVTVAGPKRAIDQALIDDLWIVLGSVAVLGLLLMLATWSQVNRALTPLRRLAENLSLLRSGAIVELPASSSSELNAVVKLINSLLEDSRERVGQAREAAAKLAHGLKTPLAMLAARFGIGGTKPDTKVTEAVGSMRYLIDQNLKLARTARASVAFAETVDVKGVVEDLVFAFAHMFRERHLSVAVEIPQDTAFRGSRDDLQEMLGNLLENAYAWADSEIKVSANRTAGGLTILIRDDGPGFPAEIRETLTRQTSADRPVDARREAAGLGLSITKEIAAGYGGRLDLTNSAGKGAVVTLSLP